MNTSYPTVSIAVPGSILDNTQTLERATQVAGQIARAACIFRINEVGRLRLRMGRSLVGALLRAVLSSDMLTRCVHCQKLVLAERFP